MIETILHDDRPDPRGRMLDVIMVAISGGRERTARELDELFQSAGFGKTTLIETTGALRMVETKRVMVRPRGGRWGRRPGSISLMV